MNALLTLAAMTAAPYLAQPPPIIHVGDPAMSGSGIRSYDNVWLVTLHYKDGRTVERGLSTDHVRPIVLGRQILLSRIESEADVVALPGKTPAGSASSTFNIFDARTMAPVRGEARATDGTAMIRDFAGPRVTTQESGKTAVTATTAEPAFDFHGGMTGLLLAALPLRIGYRARIPGIGDDGLDYTEIRVIRRDRVAAGRLGTTRAWVVEIGPSPARTVYWISKRVPYVLRCVVRGPRGYTSWDMLR